VFIGGTRACSAMTSIALQEYALQEYALQEYFTQAGGQV
jgi:hypothetical protein